MSKAANFLVGFAVGVMLWRVVFLPLLQRIGWWPK